MLFKMLITLVLSFCFEFVNSHYPVKAKES